MERHGDDEIHAGKAFGVALAHQRGERLRERTAPLVFERMDDVAKRAVVDAGGAGAPASVADGAPAGMFKERRTSGANGREKNREERVGERR
jgi:hypothetical protein